MLPNDVCRCVPFHECALKNSCRRFTEPGPWSADFSVHIFSERKFCAVYISKENVERCSHPHCGTPTQPGPCAFDACPRREK